MLSAVVVIEGAVKVVLSGVGSTSFTSNGALVLTLSNETIPPEPVNVSLKFHVNAVSDVSPIWAVR